MNRLYTGIGSRKAPTAVLRRVFEIGTIMAENGYTLRSGGASGCDATFEGGCRARDGNSEIYLPWKGFNNHETGIVVDNSEFIKIAASLYGPRWETLSHGAKKLMTRNVCQIVGLRYVNTDLVICWTPDGCETEEDRSKHTGGTGQAISLASILNIPVMNIKNESFESRFAKYLSDNGK